MRKILGILVVIVFSLIFCGNSHAQSYPQDVPQDLELNTASDVPQNFSTYSQVVFLEMMSTISCQLSGINPINPQGKCLGANGKDGKIGFVENGGVLGFINSGIAASYEFPASGSQYIAYVAQNFGLTKTAHAQLGPGGGFSGLSPFIPIWAAFRNITYLFFVLVFVVIGLGIMFRVKIDPRSVMTIQNMIPKIVVALILITMSYAIVGFLVDTMRVSTYVIYGVLSDIPGTDVTGLTPADAQDANPFTAANKFADNNNGIATITTAVTMVITDSIRDALGLGPNGLPGLSNLPVIGGVGGIFKSIINNIPGRDLISDLIGKIPIIGGVVNGLFDLLGEAGSETVGSMFNDSFTNYLIHTVSIGAGVVMGWQAAQIPTPAGGIEGGGSVFGFGFNAGGMFAPGWITGLPLGVIVGTATAAFTETLLRSLLPNIIAFFVILIALITAMFRLWFQLIKAYIYLFLYLVFAPFFLAFGILPGVETGFGSWLRTVIANLAVFPTAYLMLLLGKVLVDSVANSEVDVFVPPLIGDFSNSMAGFAAILGFGVLLLTPEVVNIVKTALKTGDNKFGSAIGKSVGIGTNIAGKPIGGVKKDLFGKDIMGAPKKGTEFMTRRFKGLGRMISGGGIVPKDPDSKIPSKIPLSTRTFGRLTKGGRTAIRNERTKNETLAKVFADNKRVKESHDYELNRSDYEEVPHETYPDIMVLRKKPTPPPDGSSDDDKKEGGPGSTTPPTSTPPASTSPRPTTSPPGSASGGPDGTSSPVAEDASTVTPDEITPEDLSQAVDRAARGVKSEAAAGTKEAVKAALLEEALKQAREKGIHPMDMANLTIMKPHISTAHSTIIARKSSSS